jgi:hypothetical protein
MRPVETIPGMGSRENTREWWKGEFKYEIVDIL